MSFAIEIQIAGSRRARAGARARAGTRIRELAIRAEVARAFGYEKEAAEIQDLYLDGKHRDAAAAVPQDWLEAANLVGPPSYVAERVAAFREAGVTHLSVSPVGEDPAALVTQVKEMMT